jgi:hypothetical protein
VPPLDETARAVTADVMRRDLIKALEAKADA